MSQPEGSQDRERAPTAGEPRGTLAIALQRADRLLSVDPALAAEQAREILKVVRAEPHARLILASALRRQGECAQARETLASVLGEQPKWPEAHLENGLALAGLGEGALAVKAIERALSLDPDLGNAWRALGDQLSLQGETEAADRAYLRHIRSSAKDPELIVAATALVEGRIAMAEAQTRSYLKQHPTDVMAIRMLAEVAARLGRFADSETLLLRCLELAPSFAPARHNLAIVRMRLNNPEGALKDVSLLLEREPKNPNYRTLEAAALVRVGEYQQAIETYETLLTEYAKQPKSWMSYGHALKTVGRTKDSIAAYQKAIALEPGLGEAYWSLANLKTYRFDAAAVEGMREQLARGDLAPDDRLHLHFALGKALEDEGAYGESFEHYEKGNAIGAERADYDEEETSERLARSSATFTEELFGARRGQGCPAGDPIFVLGMPRAGSTLIEQILSSHSEVEGTMELPDVIAIAKRLGGKAETGKASRYPEVVADLSADDLRALGEEYLARTRIQRKTEKPFFVDKMPNNFMHVGLIHLILPNAKIIDARRHPMACCFSGYKQHFAHGQNFSYGLGRIGRYYRDYVLLMRHFDEALPGVVHRVIYEQMVADPQGEIRRLLAYCGLPFEEACLNFHATERAVRTASSEQVRRPIYAEGVEHWRNYEPWLGELRAALGSVLDAYPAAPPA
jgi:tetratricopeptide (TPR) repeat protein